MNAAPLGKSERIQEIDVIRGFALFGVLWMNLVTQSYELAPQGLFDDLPTAWLDAIIEPVGDFLISGKAMALFSLLFGFGFAMIMDRLDSHGANAGRIFLRRVSILLAMGLIHIFLVWFGDILHVYALMGFLLFAVRGWSDRALLIVGLILSLLSTVALDAVLSIFYDHPYPWWEVYEAAPARRFVAVMGSSYPAYVAELWRSAWGEMWGTPDFIPYASEALGRFMLGAWIYRQGWLQNVSQYLPRFLSWSKRLLVLGVLAAWVDIGLDAMGGDLGYYFGSTPQLVLALAYGAGIVVLCHRGKCRRLFAGLAVVGRMALTNYLAQSLVYIFVLYGFGLSLLSVLGATTSLTIALLTFAVQMVFSRWWLQRYRFGPMEWLWRTLTYGERQAIRIV